MFGRRSVGLAGLVMLAAWLSVGRAGAQTAASNMSSSASLVCGTTNLLAGKRPSLWQDVRGDAGLLTDGALAPEGAQWDAPVAVVLETGAGSVTYDLGQPIPITALYLQADANDSYKIQGSLDGTRASFKPLVEIENAADRGHGLRARWVRIPSMSVRFLRVGEGVGDGFYSISEIAAYCEAPTPFPPVMRQVSAPLAAVVTVLGTGSLGGKTTRAPGWRWFWPCSPLSWSAGDTGRRKVEEILLCGHPPPDWFWVFAWRFISRLPPASATAPTGFRTGWPS